MNFFAFHSLGTSALQNGRPTTIRSRQEYWGRRGWKLIHKSCHVPFFNGAKTLACTQCATSAHGLQVIYSPTDSILSSQPFTVNKILIRKSCNSLGSGLKIEMQMCGLLWCIRCRIIFLSMIILNVY